MSMAHYPGRLKGLVLQAGPNGLLEFLAGPDWRQIGLAEIFRSTGFGPLIWSTSFGWLMNS